MVIIDLEVLRITYWLLATIFFHEYGHWGVAKQQGIYKGWGFRYGSIVIKLDRKFNSRFDYLSGLVWGYVVLPLGLLFGFSLNLLVFISIALSLGDLLALVTYNELKGDLK